MRTLLPLAIVCLGLAAAGCADPGCIRHSQCKSGYECRSNKCQLPESAAAAGSSGAAGATKAGTGSVPVRNNTSSGGMGAAAGASGQGAPVMPAAGSAGSSM